MAFGLDEFGYSHLFPSKLLQDTLTRVRNYNMIEKFKRPLHSSRAFGQITVECRIYPIETGCFRVGVISEDTYNKLQMLSPCVEK